MEIKVMKVLVKFFAAVAILASFALPALAHETGDWIVRAGVGTVDPQGTAYTDPDEPDFAIKVDAGTSLTLTGAYMFSPNLAFEVLAAWPFNHDITVLGIKIAETDHLPPTFSLQYHFSPDTTFQPYAGVGLNYTMFSGTKLAGNPAGVSLDLDDSFGFAAQLGADMMLSDKWMVNFDFRWIGIESDATISDGTSIETFKVTIDPIVYSINLGYKF
jgi:outer membrane protein